MRLNEEVAVVIHKNRVKRESDDKVQRQEEANDEPQKCRKPHALKSKPGFFVRGRDLSTAKVVLGRPPQQSTMQ